MPWQKMLFRGDTVWVHVGDDGRPVLDGDGRAEMKYREDATRSYRPGPANLIPHAATAANASAKAKNDAGASGGTRRPATRKRSPKRDADDDATASKRGHGGAALQIWTDGACSGNPGPMGIGVVVIDGGWRREHGEYLGSGTNNIAELVAIERGLELASPRVAAPAEKQDGPRAPAGGGATTVRPVRLHSDSGYALGLLGQGWKAKANQELVQRIRRALAAFPVEVELVKVRGHAGIGENERCDQLARLAIKTRGTFQHQTG